MTYKQFIKLGNTPPYQKNVQLNAHSAFKGLFEANFKTVYLK